jgi:hypothetical protein
MSRVSLIAVNEKKENYGGKMSRNLMLEAFPKELMKVSVETKLYRRRFHNHL